MNKRTILAVIGTRPEAIKMASVISSLQTRGFDVKVLTTGQHPFEMLNSGLEPFSVTVNETQELTRQGADRLGQLTANAFTRCERQDVDAILVQGDTYSTAFWPIAARCYGLPVIHLEAGLRSFTPTSAEELNRKIAGQAAGLHLAPTEMAKNNLLSEGVDDNRIHVVGNSGCDALANSGVKVVEPENRGGIFLTAHRATNVDSPLRLAKLVDVVKYLASVDTVTFPVHPRTSNQLKKHGLFQTLAETDNLLLSGPIGHLETLEHLAQSRLVVTDSGGLQEEAAWFKVPSVVVRENTPRWESVIQEISTLCSLDCTLETIIENIDMMLCEKTVEKTWETPCPYGDGTTSLQVADILEREDVWESLEVYQTSKEQA